MSTILFPAALNIELANLDLDMMRASIRQWNLEHDQMGKGKFVGRIHGVHTPRIQILDAYYSHGFMSQGDFPDNCVGLGYIKTRGRLTMHSQPVTFNEMLVLEHREGIDYFSNTESEVFSIIIEKELFHKAFLDYFGEPYELHKSKKLFFVEYHRLERNILSWIDHLKNDHQKFLPYCSYETVESAMLESFFACMHLDLSHSYREKVRFEEIRQRINESLQETKNLLDIALELKISERHMTRIFKEVLGITPKRYLQNLRLNAVNKELQSQDNRHMHIMDIALKYNFWHMGHFSVEYKKCFPKVPLKL